MKTIWMVAILLAAWTILAHSIGNPVFLEGPNIPSGPFLAVASHNCQPIGEDIDSATPAFTEALAFMRPPDVAGGQGFVSETACIYHQTDALPQLPGPGYWFVASSTCPPAFAAVVTRWQFGEQNGGGDGGCNQPGPTVCADGTPCLASEVAGGVKPIVEVGRCHVRASGFVTCRFHTRRG